MLKLKDLISEAIRLDEYLPRTFAPAELKRFNRKLSKMSKSQIEKARHDAGKLPSNDKRAWDLITLYGDELRKRAGKPPRREPSGPRGD